MKIFYDDLRFAPAKPKKRHYRSKVKLEGKEVQEISRTCLEMLLKIGNSVFQWYEGHLDGMSSMTTRRTTKSRRKSKSKMGKHRNCLQQQKNKWKKAYAFQRM